MSEFTYTPPDDFELAHMQIMDWARAHFIRRFGSCSNAECNKCESECIQCATLDCGLNDASHYFGDGCSSCDWDARDKRHGDAIYAKMRVDIMAYRQGGFTTKECAALVADLIVQR